MLPLMECALLGNFAHEVRIVSSMSDISHRVRRPKVIWRSGGD